MEGHALVTGGSRGIGRACALALAARGVDVAITYVINRAAADATAAEIEAMGREAIVLQADVGDADATREVADQAIEQLGGLDYLVANAANGQFGTIDELTPEQWDYTMSAPTRAPR